MYKMSTWIPTSEPNKSIIISDPSKRLFLTISALKAACLRSPADSCQRNETQCPDPNAQFAASEEFQRKSGFLLLILATEGL
jgi:hypothetical protein